MKNGKKFILRIAVAMMCAAMAVSALPAAAFADDVLAVSSGEGQNTVSGNCGATEADHVQWSFDETTGTLTISGTGAMEDYGYNIVRDEATQPWKRIYQSVTKVVVAEGVTYIGAHAFDGVSTVTEYDFPSTVTSMGSWSIAVHSVQTYQVAPGNRFYSVEAGMLMKRDGSDVSLVGYPCADGKTSITIPNDTTRIESGSFERNHTLTSLTLPDSVEYIGGWMFSESALESISFGTGIKKITNNAFSGVSSLKSVEFRGDVNGLNIGEWAFSKTSLTSVTIPNGTASIGGRAFYNIKTLKTVDLSGCPENFDLPQSLFSNCTALESVILPEGLKSIGDDCFSGMKALTTVKFPNRVSNEGLTIGNRAFRQTSLTNVTLPAGVKSLGSSCFALFIEKNKDNTDRNDTLTSITWNGPAKDATISRDAFMRDDGLTALIIPEGVTTLSSRAFSELQGLKYLKLPSTITSMNGATVLHFIPHLEVLDMSEVSADVDFYKDADGKYNWYNVSNPNMVAYYSSADMLEKGAGVYNIKAITNGGKIAADSTLTNTSLATPTKEGYVFDGWYTDATCATKFEGTTPENGKTYYAGWSKGRTVTLNYGYEGAEPTTETVKKDSSYTLPTPTRKGYTFAGWYNGETKVTDVSLTISEDITLTAKWTANTYTIKFDANGGTGTIGNQGATYDADVTLPENTFTNGDKIFIGWAKSADGQVVYADKATVKNLTADREVTLYAVWAVKSVPINPATPVIPSEPTVMPSVSNGWKDVSQGTVYYKNGVKVKGWQKIDGETYYFDQKGVLQTGWLDLDGHWYRLDNTGAMQTGWVKVGKSWYFMEENGVMDAATWLSNGGKWYYLGADGTMYSNKWRCTKGVWYYLLGNGEMAKNRWIEDKGDWYYFGSDGAMLVSATAPDGSKLGADGKWIG